MLHCSDFWRSYSVEEDHGSDWENSLYSAAEDHSIELEDSWRRGVGLAYNIGLASNDD